MICWDLNVMLILNVTVLFDMICWHLLASVMVMLYCIHVSSYCKLIAKERLKMALVESHGL